MRRALPLCVGAQNNIATFCAPHTGPDKFKKNHESCDSRYSRLPLDFIPQALTLASPITPVASLPVTRFDQRSQAARTSANVTQHASPTKRTSASRHGNTPSGPIQRTRPSSFQIHCTQHYATSKSATPSSTSTQPVSQQDKTR